ELDYVRRVSLDELEARVREEVLDRLPAVHERIEDAHPPALSEELLDDVRADVAGAADHEDRTHPVAQEGRPDGLHQPALPARPTVRAVAVAVRGAAAVAVHDVCSLVASHPKIAATVRAIRRRSRPRL